MICEIHLKERLSPDWVDWLGGLTITNLASGEARLAGRLADQTALLGVLNRIHGMNLTILSMTCYAQDITVS